MHSVQTDLPELERHARALARIRAAAEMPVMALQRPVWLIHPTRPPVTVTLLANMGGWCLIRHALTGASWVETNRLRPIARRLSAIDGGRA